MVKLLLDRGSKIDAKTKVRPKLPAYVGGYSQRWKQRGWLRVSCVAAFRQCGPKMCLCVMNAVLFDSLHDDCSPVDRVVVVLQPC